MKLINVIKETVNDVKERDMFEGLVDDDFNISVKNDFDVNEFKKLNSFAKKIKYAKEKLGKPVGNGSARIVFIIDNTKVLKLAKNTKGIIQNDIETTWADEYYFEDILANIIDYDEGGCFWVIMELAKKVRKSDFKRILGIDVEIMDLYLYNFYLEQNGKKPRYKIDSEDINKLDKSDFVQKLKVFMDSSDTLPGDIGKISSFGLVNRDGNEKIVLIDFGLTNKAYESYYK